MAPSSEQNKTNYKTPLDSVSSFYLPFSQCLCPSLQLNLRKEDTVYICCLHDLSRSHPHIPVWYLPPPFQSTNMTDDFHKGDSNGNPSDLIKLKFSSAFNRTDNLFSI